MAVIQGFIMPELRPKFQNNSFAVPQRLSDKLFIATTLHEKQCSNYN